MQTSATLIVREASSHIPYQHSAQHRGKAIVDDMTRRWNQRFMLKNNIVSRYQTDELMVSPEKKFR